MRTVLRICILLLLSASAAQAAAADLARQVLAETNLARSEPRRYAAFIREFKGYFVGKAYRGPGAAAVVMTKEGTAALDEAIRFLSRQRPVPPLSWSPGLARSAAHLVREQTNTGAVGHDTAGGMDMRDRIEKQGSWLGTIGENISYGPDTARQIVMGLIIDDGVPDRGHRKNIFNTAFKTAGTACGPHPVYRTICVTDFATGFRDKSEPE